MITGLSLILVADECTDVFSLHNLFCVLLLRDLKLKPQSLHTQLARCASSVLAASSRQRRSMASTCFLSPPARALSQPARALSPWTLALATVGLFSTPALTLSIGFLSPPAFPSVDSSYPTTNGSLTSAAVGVDGRGAGTSTDHNHGAALNQPAAAGRWSQVSSPSSRTQPNAPCFRTQDRSRQKRSCIDITPCAFTAFYIYVPPSPSFISFFFKAFFLIFNFFK